MSTQDVRIFGVIDEDPFHFSTWSGISYYFFDALKRAGHLYHAVGATPSLTIQYTWKLLSFHPNLARWRFKYHINTSYFRQMTRTARARISQFPENEYNVILQVGAWYDLTQGTKKPVVSYHDGNLACLLNSPYGYPRVRRRYVDRALRHERALYHRLHHIFPMSRWLASSFMNDFGVPSSNLTPVGAGINLPYTHPVINKTYGEPKILFVGKDFSRKGGQYLLEAFDIVRRDLPDATLTLIGPNLVAPGAGVRCLGPLSKSDAAGIDRLLAEYASASIFVMPSLYEPFGVVFAEAMAHKLPCIGTNICAIPEIVENGVTGYVVPPRDSRALADRIISLLKNPAECRALGENGYAKYLADFTWDRVSEKLVAQIRV